MPHFQRHPTVVLQLEAVTNVSVMDITDFVVTQRDKALPVGNYGSYRTQLSRRLLRVRRKLDFQSVKAQKYTAKAPVSARDIRNDHE